MDLVDGKRTIIQFCAIHETFQKSITAALVFTFEPTFVCLCLYYMCVSLMVLQPHLCAAAASRRTRGDIKSILQRLTDTLSQIQIHTHTRRSPELPETPSGAIN